MTVSIDIYTMDARELDDAPLESGDKRRHSFKIVRDGVTIFSPCKRYNTAEDAQKNATKYAAEVTSASEWLAMYCWPNERSEGSKRQSHRDLRLELSRRCAEHLRKKQPRSLFEQEYPDAEFRNEILTKASLIVSDDDSAVAYAKALRS